MLTHLCLSVIYSDLLKLFIQLELHLNIFKRGQCLKGDGSVSIHTHNLAWLGPARNLTQSEVDT